MSVAAKTKTKRQTEWPQRLDAAIKKKFGVETETFFDLIGSMRYLTHRPDGKPLAKKIHTFIGQWMAANA